MKHTQNNNMKARSITSKVKSVCQMNATLVQGAADLGYSKKFKNYGKDISDPITSKNDKIDNEGDGSSEESE